MLSTTARWCKTNNTGGGGLVELGYWVKMGRGGTGAGTEAEAEAEAGCLQAATGLDWIGLDWQLEPGVH